MNALALLQALHLMTVQTTPHRRPLGEVAPSQMAKPYLLNIVPLATVQEDLKALSQIGL